MSSNIYILRHQKLYIYILKHPVYKYMNFFPPNKKSFFPKHQKHQRISYLEGNPTALTLQREEKKLNAHLHTFNYKHKKLKFILDVP